MALDHEASRVRPANEHAAVKQRGDLIERLRQALYGVQSELHRRPANRQAPVKMVARANGQGDRHITMPDIEAEDGEDEEGVECRIVAKNDHVDSSRCSENDNGYDSGSRSSTGSEALEVELPSATPLLPPKRRKRSRSGDGDDDREAGDDQGRRCRRMRPGFANFGSSR